MLGDSEGLIRTVTFVPEETGEARLELVAVGVSSNELLAVQEINGVQSSKMPVLQLIEGQPCEVQVRLNEAYRGPVRMVLSRKNKEGLLDEN